jgi:outer membrane protein assembly factor BamB
MRKSRVVLVLSFLSLALTLAASGMFVSEAAAVEDTLHVTEHLVASSSAREIWPTIGNDGTSDLVVFTVQPWISGVPGPADIWYQRLDANGAPDGLARQVTSADTDDQLNDVSGDYIVYTAFESTTSSTGTIMLYQISTRDLQPLASATIIQEPRIHGDFVVWSEGPAPGATQIMLYDIDWLGTTMKPLTIAGPLNLRDVQIGDRQVVWAERTGGQYDIMAYDLQDAMCFAVTDTADVDETNPATSGPWVMWRAQAHGALTSTIEGINLDTLERRVIADNGAVNRRPSMDMDPSIDLVTWESNVTGNWDVFVYRMQTGVTYQVTTDPADQFLNDVFGNLVAYVDTRGLSEDIYVSKLEFPPPVADANGPYTGTEGIPVTFDASGSYDPDGTIISYEWNFGDSTTGTGVNPTHTYTQYGTYTVTLTVTDNLGETDTDTTTATITTKWWPMFHHDLNHTGYSTSTAPNTNFTLWTYTTDHWVHSSPAVADSKVYVGSVDYNVYALDATTGAYIWNYTTGHWVRSSPAVADGKVYVSSFDDKVYCLDATTGAHIWNYTTGSDLFSSPTVANGKVYIGSYDNKVYALDASTGAHIWSYKTGSMVLSSPAVADGKVYVGSADGKVYALDASSGALIWSYTTGSGVRSSPAVADGKVYIGSDDYKVYALDATTGSLVWSYTTGDYVYSSPAVADGMVYVGSADGKVYALDATTGAHIWNYTTGGIVDSSPAVADGKVYVGSWDNNIYALEATTGARIWSYTTGDDVRSSPAVADSMVYVGSYDSRVYAFGGVPTNTPAGTAITATDPTTGVTVTFNEVTLSGTTSVATSDTGPEAPTGFTVAGVYYDITTTATYTDTIQITIPYDETLVIGNEEDLKIMQWNPDTQEWTDITTWVDTTNNIIHGQATTLSIFAVMEPTYGTISGAVTDEYTGEPIQGVAISILETDTTTTTDAQGKYSFIDLEAGSYTVEMTLPYGYLTHDAVTKFIDVLATQDTEVNFTLYQASWSDATIPRTIGYWKNWDKHYTQDLMQTFIENVKTASGLFNTLTIDNINTYFKITRHSTMEEKGKAQLLASWLNVASAQLGVDVQVDLTSISGWETVIADTDGILTVNDLLNQIDQLYLNDATLNKEQLETIKDILDALNNGQLFT